MFGWIVRMVFLALELAASIVMYLLCLAARIVIAVVKGVVCIVRWIRKRNHSQHTPVGAV